MRQLVKRMSNLNTDRFEESQGRPTPRKNPKQKATFYKTLSENLEKYGQQSVGLYDSKFNIVVRGRKRQELLGNEFKHDTIQSETIEDLIASYIADCSTPLSNKEKLHYAKKLVADLLKAGAQWVDIAEALHYGVGYSRSQSYRIIDKVKDPKFSENEDNKKHVDIAKIDKAEQRTAAIEGIIREIAPFKEWLSSEEQTEGVTKLLHFFEWLEEQVNRLR